MPNPSVFISHASKDDPFVQSLRQALESHQVRVWADSRELRPGDLLQPEIERAIAAHDHFFIVVSNHTFQSKWVKKELEFAKSLQKRAVALLLDGQTVGALAWLFDEEPVAISVSAAAGGLQSAMPEILVAVGLRKPADASQSIFEPDESKYNDLILVLENPQLFTEGGLRRGRARTFFEMHPGDGSQKIDTEPFDFICPLGPIEAGLLRQYIEEMPRSAFLKKMLPSIRELEAQIFQWGKKLLDALTDDPDAREKFWEWKGDPVHERRFSVLFKFFNEKKLPAENREAISLLVGTPWEILHDGKAFLFQGKKPVRVRRQLPNRGRRGKIELQNSLRVLLVSPRPDDDQAEYIDHRIAPEALLAATDALGSLVEVKLLETPTFEALCRKIELAERQKRPFSVVHFDGHGVFDPHRGLGALCFESNEPAEQQKLDGRKTHIVHTDQIAAALKDFRIPFFFLDACQSAMTHENPTGSVAATLLETGVASVAAMSHSVLVATAGKFAENFYRELARGARIGSAMLAGQRALHADPVRAHLPDGERLELQDWFVPVLYQEQNDPPLVKKIPSAAAQNIHLEARKAEQGEMPPPPPHGFIGRNRELLALERLLHLERYAVLVGQGGAGKTTLATELARWMHRSQRARRLAFVSFENLRDVRSAIDALGRQLVSRDFSVATCRDEDEALQFLDRALDEFETVVVLDNMESILPAYAPHDPTPPDPLKGEAAPDSAPPSGGRGVRGGWGVLPGVEPFQHFSTFFSKLKQAGARLIFTTREPLPAPFDSGRCHRHLGKLTSADALRLIAGVRREAGLEEPPLNIEDLEKKYGTLALRLNYHARACALLAKNIPSDGAALTQLDADLASLMADLDKKHPNDRENSLFASLELSLRRLPDAVHEVVDALAVFHGGADLVGWAAVAECERDDIEQVGKAMEQVGLAEQAHQFFFKIDPALPAYLAARTAPDLLVARQARWLEGMVALSRFLYQQKFENTQLAHDLAFLAEANLLAMLAELSKTAAPEQVVDISDNIESLFSNISRPQVVLFAQKLREQAAGKMGGWSHAQYLHQSAATNRFLEQNNLNAAFQLAQQTLAQCEQAGTDAYPEAAYDWATAVFRLGRILELAGRPEKALPLLEDAERRFSALSASGNANAARMASVCLTEMGDCFRHLGKYDAAAEQYEKALILDEKRGDLRDVATGKGQLATIRMEQKNYPEALRLHHEAKDIFEQFREPAMVAVAWHQIGMVHEEEGKYPKAEAAYLESLAIFIREKNKAGEASSLGQLGNLYQYSLGRLEDAVQVYQRAAGIYSALGDLRSEGVTCSNLADCLLKLHRPADARTQLLRAIECKSQFGHAARPWTTWDILCDLETAEGNQPAAAAARQKAVQAYLAYRRDGGQSQSNRFNWVVATAQAMQSGQVEELAAEFQTALQQDRPTFVKALLRALLALLQGERNPALADDPELWFMDAVELKLVFFGG